MTVTPTGRRVQWCPTCRMFYRVIGEPRVPPACSICHEPPLTRKCYRCGHEWTPRRYNRDPRQCPKCKSPYWNRLRTSPPGRPRGGEEEI